MSTYTKRALSGSTNGKMIRVNKVATAGTLIHTAVAGTNDFDEVWLYAMNNHTSNLSLTIEWGGVTSPDDLIVSTIPYKSGLYLVVPGLVLQNELVIGAFSTSASLIDVTGWVNRITV